MAQKQALTGICFNALLRMGGNSEDGWRKLGIPEMVYLKWMAKTAIIRKRNEQVNRQCVGLHELLSIAGFRSCILKGQGVAQHYRSTDSLSGGEYEADLSHLRQAGDIDVWMYTQGSLSERRKKIIQFARDHTPDAKAFIHHVDCELFEDTEVELHYLPSWFNSPIHHSRFVKWCEKNATEQMKHKVGDIVSPTPYFNSIYLLAHICQHLFQEGIGLRQVMDYYFVLNSTEAKNIDKREWQRTISSLGLSRLASAVMWIMAEIFALPENKMLCQPNEKEGRFLMSEIMEAGNFGKYDERIERNGETGTRLLFKHTKRNMHFLTHYPSETLWSPIWKIWHWAWRKSIN